MLKRSALPLLMTVWLFLSFTGCQSVVTTTASVISTRTATQTVTQINTQTATVTATATPVVTTTTVTPVTLNLSMAASLANAAKELNAAYTESRPWVNILLNTASSGTIQQQIENGAPCDVFVSAAAAQMDNLQAKGLLADASRKNLLVNKVVLIVPSNSTLGITGFADLASDKVKLLAIGDPASVPAGTYGQQALDLLGITDKVKPKYVMGASVTQVLNYVESGNADAGIVYSTDALSSTKVKVVANAPDEINAKVVYPASLIKASKVQSAAQDYLDFLFSAQAKAIFEKYGFSMAK
jgi:molybdate transport system substrate-binding protein